MSNVDGVATDDAPTEERKVEEIDKDDMQDELLHEMLLQKSVGKNMQKLAGEYESTT